ncbi:MAG: hypothetical protein SynsKO_31250 [Synoicihabitans sp.]
MELRDGRLWMLLRTSQDYHYESYSADGGASWSPAEPSRFVGSLTMPTLHRLPDDRILLLWNNTMSMPEPSADVRQRINPGYNPKTQRPYVLAFTNRDALHAAISADEGKTWTGFREVWLNELRNADDLEERGGVDLSVHQTQVVDLPNGNVLISAGQHRDARVLLIFNPDWLDETQRIEDFGGDLEGWSVHQYIASAVGHRRYNRKVGPAIVADASAVNGKALHLNRTADPKLLVENDGAVWNFPAGQRGTLMTRVKLPAGSQGGRISLLDRWMNPTDPTAHLFATTSIQVEADGRINSTSARLIPGQWHQLLLSWDKVDDEENAVVTLQLDGNEKLHALPIRNIAVNGLSYAHFFATAVQEDETGFLVDFVRAKRLD